MTETPQDRIKRMAMRSWRRGTKEMDLILGPWADAHLPGLSAERLDAYDALLAENDQDLMAWILGHAQPPVQFDSLLSEIGTFARGRMRKI